MVKMLFSYRQEPVTITPLPNGKYDVMVLANEEYVERKSEEMGEPVSSYFYSYDGNSFRTVYKLTEEQIQEDMDKWLNYSSDGEPTLEQIAHDNELTDRLVLELVEGGIL